MSHLFRRDVLRHTTHVASEIAAVTGERVSRLDEDQRQLLREALDEVAVGQAG